MCEGRLISTQPAVASVQFPVPNPAKRKTGRDAGFGDKKILAQSLDEYLRGNVALAMDIIAGRLRSLVHVDLTGRWKEAEQLAAERTKDIGLTSGRDLYEARKHAKLINLVNSSSSEGESDSPPERKAQRPKKKRKRGKKTKKKVEEKDK